MDGDKERKREAAAKQEEVARTKPPERRTGLQVLHSARGGITWQAWETHVGGQQRAGSAQQQAQGAGGGGRGGWRSLRNADARACARAGGMLAMQGSVTEVVGEAGAGKSQLGLHMALLAQLGEDAGGMAGGTLLLPSSPLPSARLAALAAPFEAQHALAFRPALDGVVVAPVLADVAALLAFLAGPVYGLLNQPARRIRLLLLDSLAELVRGQCPDARSQAATLLHVSAALRRIAAHYPVAVVVLNQVSSSLSSSLSSSPSSSAVVPALGLAWSNCVTTRLLVARTPALHALARPPAKRRRRAGEDEEEEEGEHGVEEVPVRTLSVVLSPCMPPVSLRFAITPTCILPL